MGFRKETEILITKAEKVFKSSWEVLVSMKNQDNDKDKILSLIDFQSNLAEILFSLEKFRNEIIQEEKRIVSRKNHCNNNWFVQKLKSLGNYKKAIVSVSNMGKAIGDSFAYWFYREDLELLEEHREHVKIKHFPTGTGGIGEIEFIEKMKNFDNKLVIYHGTTTILRIGDVSLFDLEKLQIVALGDLKTKKIGKNEISVELILFSPKTRNAFDVKKVTKAKPIEYIDNARLERQMKSISKALRIYSPNNNDSNFNLKKDLEDKLHTKEIEELYNISNSKNLANVKVSDSIIFTGYKDNTKDLKNKFLGNKKYNPTESDKNHLVNLVKQTLKDGSLNNSIILDELLYDKNNEVNSSRGTAPLFWLPIPEKILKDIYFKSFFVVVLFNPVYLIETFIEQGIHIKSKYYPSSNSPKSDKSGQRIIEGFDLLIPYITQHLQTENSIIKSIEMVQNEMKQKQLNPNVGCKIKIQQVFFGNKKTRR